MYDCGACERLWREYSDATMSHIKVSSRRQIATLQHDSIAVDTLDRGERH